MTPAFTITANGDDITHIINDRLKELVVSDEAGLKADALSIYIDDRDAAVALPTEGAQLRVAMGYRETGLIAMGTYISDEVTLNFPDASMAIRGQSANMTGMIKAPKTRNWDNMSVAAIVKQIASDHGLEPAVDSEKGSFIYKHLAQTNESDLHLLTRISKAQDAIAAIKDGRLIFSLRGAGFSISGEALPVREIRPHEIKSGNVTLTTRDKYKAVIARWNDKKTRKKRDVKVGGGEPIYSIRHIYPTQEEAQKGAQSKLDEFTRGTDKLSLYMEGDPSIVAETQLRLSGFRDGVNGQWSVKTAVHRLNSSGYSTDITAEKPTVQNEG